MPDLHALSGQLNTLESGASRQPKAGYTRALELDRDNLQALIGLSNLSIVDQDFEKAKEYLDRAAVLGPQNFVTTILSSYVCLGAQRLCQGARTGGRHTSR